MLINNRLFPNGQFNEIVVADLSNFQIAIPTTTKTIKKPIFSSWISFPKRIYDSQGWLICDRKIVAFLEGLKIGTLVTDNSPFKPIAGLHASIPISFNIKSSLPLPKKVLSKASFACKLTQEVFTYHAVFQDIVPRFTSIYVIKAGSLLLDKVEQMLKTEAVFISQNYKRLKQVPFYQENFGL